MHPLAAGRADRPFGRRLVRPLIVVRRGPVLQCGALLSLCAAVCAWRYVPMALCKSAPTRCQSPARACTSSRVAKKPSICSKCPFLPASRAGRKVSSLPRANQTARSRCLPDSFFFRHFLSPAPARPGRQRCRVFRAPLSPFATIHPSFLQGCYFFSICVTTVRTPRLELAYFAKGALF